jgi:hypothetical protein
MRRFLLLLPVLAGAAVIGCGRREEPSSFDAQRPAIVAAAAHANPLPASAMQVRWGTVALPKTVEADKDLEIDVKFTNAGDVVWPDKVTGNPSLKDGGYAVRLTHAWVRAEDAEDGRIGAGRTDMPRPLNPGDSMELRVQTHTPVKPGEYRLIMELVQELVVWFADLGGARLTWPIHVVAAAPAGAGTTALQPTQPPKAPVR